MINLLKNLDVAAVLSLGAVGLGFFLAIFAYWLLGREQKVNEPRASILKAIYVYMVFAILLVTLGICGRVLDNSSFRTPHTTPEVRRAIKTLSPVTVLALVAMSTQGLLYEIPPVNGQKDIIDTLVSSKLVKELSVDEISVASAGFIDKRFVYGVAPTRLGLDAKAYLDGVIEELVRAD